MLTNLALANLIFNDKVQFTVEERIENEKLLNDRERYLILHGAENETVQILSAKLKTALDEMEIQNPTSKLWVRDI